MPSYNKVILMGNLTRDPELRVTPSGANICKISIATSRRYKTQSGEEREETTFIDVDCFGRQAEIISKYFTKGKPILVEGRLRYDQWESKNGEKRSKLTVTLENFQFVGSRQDNEFSDSGGYESHSPLPRTKTPKSNEPPPPSPPESSSPRNDMEEDVPF